MRGRDSSDSHISVVAALNQFTEGWRLRGRFSALPPLLVPLAPLQGSCSCRLSETGWLRLGKPPTKRPPTVP